MLGAQKPSDHEILDKIKNGDQRMLLFLYKRNIDPVKSYILRNNGHQADVEDMLQEALVIFWQNAQKADFVLNSKLDTYLYAIAKNLWLKQLRKSNRISYDAFDADYLPEIADKESEYTEDKYAVLSKYLHQLGETCRTLLTFFYFEQWDMIQIAEKMNFANADTAKAKKYQCKKKLELLIKEHFTSEELL